MVDTESTFKADNKSLKYLDPKQERDYSILHKKFVLQFGKLLMLEMLILNVLELIVTIIGYINGDYDSMVIAKVFGISAAMQIFIFLHYKGCGKSLMYS